MKELVIERENEPRPCRPSNKLCSFGAKNSFFSALPGRALLCTFVYSQGMLSLQHALGGQNPQTEIRVLPWPFTSLSGRNYPKALPLGGMMKAQIRGQVAHH